MPIGGIRLSRNTKISLLVVGLGFIVAFGTWYAKAIRPPKEINLQEIAKRQDLPAPDPDPVHMSTSPASDAIHGHLLDGDFAIIHRMRKLSDGCRVAFESSFVSSSVTGRSSGEIDFADPDQDFNYGDVIREGLPFRQLHFAGLGPKSCFVYYERGGQDYASSCLAVVLYAGGRTIWVGVTHKKAHNLRELRSLFLNHKFEDASGRDC